MYLYVKKFKDIVITTALRTPIGRYNGLFKDKHAHELGNIIIKEILNKSNLKPNDIDEVIMGQVLTGLTGRILQDKLQYYLIFLKKLLT